MERESFENEEIGRLLNDSFVSIKVDREERPDVDRVYMSFIHVCRLFLTCRDNAHCLATNTYPPIILLQLTISQSIYLCILCQCIL